MSASVLSKLKSVKRVGHNPVTREEIQIPASKAVTFKVSKNLKDRVNK